MLIKMVNKADKQKLWIVGAIILFLILQSQDTLKKEGVPDSTICDPNYAVCFTTNADKTFPSPFNLKDMSDDRAVIASSTSQGGGILHYPGSIMKVDTEGLINYRAGVGRTKITLKGSSQEGQGSINNLLKVECGSMEKFEWRPDKVVWACNTFGGESQGRKAEIQTHPINKYAFLVKFNGQCINPSDSCFTKVTASEVDENVIVGGVTGQTAWRQTINDGTVNEFTIYTIFRDPPDSIVGSEYRWHDTFENVALVILDNDLSQVDDMLNNPDTYIAQAYADFDSWFNQFKKPEKCSGGWCEDRYWRSVMTHANALYEEYPPIPSLWNGYSAMSPGSQYLGTWIWDSFFASWAWINNCKSGTCVDTIFDSLRILTSNKYGTGQWPREVKYNFKNPGWQAPGGWSFAVDQADRKLGGSAYSSEFYSELVEYHNWIRDNQDSDGDNLFEWSGTNSGWDGSIRWSGGKGDEALDLNAWMILDAESLRNIAERTGLTADANMWEQRRLDYVSAYQNLCSGSLCYDQSKSNVRSDVMTAAMYFSMLAGAVSQQKAEEMVAEMYNPSTLGSFDATGIGVLPTVARNSAGFCPCASGCPVWSGTNWINVNGIAYLGMLRYGLTADAEYLRQATLKTLEMSSFGYESYCSADEGARVAGEKAASFGGDTYVWSDAFHMLFVSDVDFDYTPVSGGGACTPTCNYPDTCSESVADGCGGTCTRTTEGNACGASGTCTGGVCQGSTFVPYTSVELEQKFDQVDLAWNGGTGASSSNSVSFWTWDNTPLVEGYLNMYMATGQTKYLDSFVANTDTLIGKASDSDSDGLLDWGALQSGIDPVLDYSRITFPFVKFAYIVKKDNLAAYMNKADQYQSFVETNIIPLYDAIYATCSNMGFWKEGVQSAPNNRAAFIGRTHLYLYLISGNSVYETKSIEYANKIKSTLLERTDGPTGSPYYFWNYNNKAGCQTIGNTWSCSVSCAADQDDICDTNPSAWSCSGPLELGYGNYDIMTILDYYEAGIVFASSDLQKLINTVKEGLLVETAIVGGIDTPVMTANADPNNIPITWGNGPYSQTAQSAHWGRLGHYDTTIKTAFDKIVRFTIEHNEASGNNYYSSPYECVIDTRNGVEMCGDDLTGAHRSTPAFSTSMIAHQRLGSETLTLIGSGGGAPVCSLSFNNYISYANSWVECNSPTCS